MPCLLVLTDNTVLISRPVKKGIVLNDAVAHGDNIKMPTNV